MANLAYSTFHKSKRNLSFDFTVTLRDFVEEDNLLSVVESLIELLPESTFDAVQPFDAGRLFYTGLICDELVAPFVDDLYRVHLNLEHNLPIEITLNSGGGDVYAGQALIGAIQHIQLMGREVNITAQGSAASMASIILQVGNIRRIGANTTIMLHEVSSRSQGKLSSQAEDLEATQKLQDTLFGYYVARTGQPLSYYHDKLKKKDVYMHADEALAEGLVDEVIKGPDYSLTPPKALNTEVVATKIARKRVAKNG